MATKSSKTKSIPIKNSNGLSLLSSKATAPMANESSSSDKRAIWYYNDGDSSDISWIPFGDIDNEILEEALLTNKKQVQLDECLIDLEKSSQIDKRNPSIERSIKRSIVQRHETPLRTERFNTPQKLVKSFTDKDINDRRFINEWQKRYRNLTNDEKLEQAAKGIIKEGTLLEKQIEAEWIAQQLRSMKGKTLCEVEKHLIFIYTKESFLYRLINTTLRENDQSKVDNLGAFCQLLFRCDCSSTMGQLGYAGELYRGAQLDEQTIESYKQAIGLVKTWDAFSSTSKDRKKAECFGNVLFIINRSKSSRYRYSGMDISSISHYPDEEEVLIRAIRNFIVEKVEKDETTGKYYIYLSLC